MNFDNSRFHAAVNLCAVLNYQCGLKASKHTRQRSDGCLVIDQVQKDNGQQRVAIAKRDGRRSAVSESPLLTSVKISTWYRGPTSVPLIGTSRRSHS